MTQDIRLSKTVLADDFHWFPFKKTGKIDSNGSTTDKQHTFEVAIDLWPGVPVLKALDDGRGVDRTTAQAEDELDRRGAAMNMQILCLQSCVP